ncbi:MAG: creatininase family protein [Synechococcales cyanobacterium]
MVHGFIPPQRFFPYLTWPEVAALPDKANTVLIQPVAAIEQHGHHLPLVVDTAIGMGVIGRALTLLDPDIPAFALPPLCYGKSNEHWHFPGTITLSATTLMAVLTEVAESLYRAGFRKVVFSNSHGGQPQVIEIVARDLRQRYDDFYLFPLAVWRVPHRADHLIDPDELANGLHGGDAETSMMLHLLPETVHMERAVKEYPPNFGSSLLSPEGSLPFAWVTRDLSTTGTIGDPLPATAAKGEALIQELAQGWVQVITEIHHFRSAQL